MKTTRRHFERTYAPLPGVRTHLYRLGVLPAVRCDCGEGGCRGWRRRYQDDWPDGDPWPRDGSDWLTDGNGQRHP